MTEPPNFVSAPADLVAVAISATGKAVSRAVVGYFVGSGLTAPAVLDPNGTVTSLAAFLEADQRMLAGIIRHDDAVDRDAVTRAHERAAEPLINREWRAFHATHGHDACGIDDLEASPEAEALTGRLVARFGVHEHEAECPHFTLGCTKAIGCESAESGGPE